MLMSNVIGKDDSRRPYSKLKRENIISNSNSNSNSNGKTNSLTTSPKPKSGGSGTKKIMNQGLAREQGINNPNKLRIIAGTAKGKKIESPDMYLRPMMAKVREALFSTLNHMGLFDSNTTKVLDTFSGSGSVGLEALSRGAAHVTFVDFSQNCIDTSLRNAISCGFPGQAKAVCAKVEEVFTDPLKFQLNEPYQLISITPPYKEVSYPQLINDICNSSLVCEDTIVIIEYPVEMGTLPYILGDNKLFGIRNRKYGRTVLGIYVYRPNKKYDMRPEEFTPFKK
jgi:16S rRNA (guanine(966)-N(2))-methyltransferase RsmD